MKKNSRKFKIELNAYVATFTSDSGEVFKLTDEELSDNIKSYMYSLINTFHEESKEECKNLDIIHEFNSFKVDDNMLCVYDESNKETYKHFIHKYLKDYYVDSQNSNHGYNGGYWEHSNYNPLDKLHERMLNYKEIGVRDNIIMHLISADGVRMYGNPMYYKRVVDLDSSDDLKKFFKFILDSKMFDVNDKFINSKKFKDNSYLESSSEDIFSIAELLILECWRNNHNLDVVKWLISKYNMDLYKIEKYYVPSVTINDKKYSYPVVTDIKKSFLAHLITKLHDKRIHDTYNNGVLCRKYSYEKKLLSTDEQNLRWENDYFYNLVDFIKYIIEVFPKLSVVDYDFKSKKMVEYDGISSWLTNNLLSDLLRDEDNGTRESVDELIKLLK